MITYLYKLIMVIVNNPIKNPIAAKVIAVIFIAVPPLKKKEVYVCGFLCSSSWFASIPK